MASPLLKASPIERIEVGMELSLLDIVAAPSGTAEQPVLTEGGEQGEGFGDLLETLLQPQESEKSGTDPLELLGNVPFAVSPEGLPAPETQPETPDGSETLETVLVATAGMVAAEEAPIETAGSETQLKDVPPAAVPSNVVVPQQRSAGVSSADKVAERVLASMLEEEAQEAEKESSTPAGTEERIQPQAGQQTLGDGEAVALVRPGRAEQRGATEIRGEVGTDEEREAVDPVAVAGSGKDELQGENGQGSKEVLTAAALEVPPSEGEPFEAVADGQGPNESDEAGRAESGSEAAEQAGAEEMPKVSEEQLLTGLAREIQVLADGEGGKARIQLEPEHLGQVKIELEVKDGEVKVHLIAENPEALELLEENLDELRELLGHQELELEECSVELNDRESDENDSRQRYAEYEDLNLFFQLPGGEEVARPSGDSVGYATSRLVGGTGIDIRV